MEFQSSRLISNVKYRIRASLINFLKLVLIAAQRRLCGNFSLMASKFLTEAATRTHIHVHALCLQQKAANFFLVIEKIASQIRSWHEYLSGYENKFLALSKFVLCQAERRLDAPSGAPSLHKVKLCFVPSGTLAGAAAGHSRQPRFAPSESNIVSRSKAAVRAPPPPH